jgi:hypothetical protein
MTARYERDRRTETALLTTVINRLHQLSPFLGDPKPSLANSIIHSLRDGATRLLHHVPSQHKARLIELGYIEELFWRHSINERWQDEGIVEG